MPRVSWRRTRIVVAALGLALMVTVALGLLWFDWDWKALIGWRALVDYINPENATGRKDAVQVYAVIVAGGIAFITAAVGLSNLGLTSGSLKQQRDLEAQRAQDTAPQAYYEQIGKLLTEHDLLNTDREDIRALAKGQTLTVLRELDASRKKSVLSFLHEAELIAAGGAAAIRLADADLTDANLFGIDLTAASITN
jgi:hypothetical protein